MFSRRAFIATSAAALTLPAAGRAQQAHVYDPTPQVVSIKKDFAPGQILILPGSFYLYYVTEPRKAIRYGIAVGKEGLAWKGTAVIQVKKEWPTWRPTDEMIERDPRTYSKFVNNDYVQPGGPTNPLGARAMYLFENGKDTAVRIHGTIAPESIGTASSNGCFRMVNESVIDLYDRVPIGTQVTVL